MVIPIHTRDGYVHEGERMLTEILTPDRQYLEDEEPEAYARRQVKGEDWARARSALNEHFTREVPLEKAVDSVFQEKIAPGLFFAGEPVKPVKKSGIQSEVTEEVARAALRAFRKPPTEEELALLRQDPERMLTHVTRLVSMVRRLRKVRLREDHWRKLYSKQTARDIIETGSIPVWGNNGCLHASVAMVSLLRALGVKSWFVRTRDDWLEHLLEKNPRQAPSTYPHSLVEFEIAGRHYVADTWKRPEVIDITPYMHLLQKRFTPTEVDAEKLSAEELKATRRKHGWVRGSDAWGLGMLSHSQFSLWARRNAVSEC